MIEKDRFQFFIRDSWFIDIWFSIQGYLRKKGDHKGSPLRIIFENDRSVLLKS